QKVANLADKLADVLLEIEALIDNDADDFKQRLGVSLNQSVERSVEDLARDKSQNVTHIIASDFLSTKRDDLIQQRLCIAHAAFGGFDNVTERAVVDLYAFAIGDLPEVLVNFSGGNGPEDKLLAA